MGVRDPEKGFHVSTAGTVNSGSPITEDTHMYVGSVTKTMTATAILRLVDQGKLSLDDTIAELLPDMANQFPDIANVPVQRLLDMSSGIPDYVNVSDGGILPVMLDDPTTSSTAEALVKAALDANPVAPQGTPGYSNTNFVLLGEILAMLTGKPMADAINDTLTAAGLTQTRIDPDRAAVLPEPASAGYNGEAEGEQAKALNHDYGADTDVSDWNKSRAGAAGAAYTTVGDYAKWAGTALGTTLLSEELGAQRLTRRQSATTSPRSWASTGWASACEATGSATRAS